MKKISPLVPTIHVAFGQKTSATHNKVTITARSAAAFGVRFYERATIYLILPAQSVRGYYVVQLSTSAKAF
ncbi:MAG TPA: hypothetical protein VFP87_00465 [Chitinophagaceae bacterium]|nr:hypothetical protein [Chitinophagaceae bacterium]